MAKFHITDDGPKPCRASVRDCPIGGEHFTSQEKAQKVYAASRGKGHLKGISRGDREAFTDLNSGKIAKDLEKAPLYRKSVVVTMRTAKDGEALTTVLSDGSVETSRVLKGGEIIVRNPTGEEYAMDREKFMARYENTDGEWRAKGKAQAMKNPTGSPIVIMAPWGEEQRGDENCYIAMNPDSPSDRYIIGGKEFAETYTPMGGKENFPKIYGSVAPIKGGSYYGSHVSEASIQPFRDSLRKSLGDEKFNEYVQAKEDRDGASAYHITAISPPETRKLKKAGVKITPPPTTEFEAVGIGHAVSGDNEAWYVVCESPKLQEWRGSLGLPPHDLHVTLAFKGKDVHGQDKGRATLI